MEEMRPRNNKELRRVWNRLTDPDDRIEAYQRVALGNGTALNIGMFWIDRAENLFVGVEEFGSYVFSGFVHWTYLAEKIKGLCPWDYQNLADFLNVQLGNDGPIQGRYPYD